jgi:hypothetical protein
VTSTSKDDRLDEAGLTWGQANLLGWMQLKKTPFEKNVVIGDLDVVEGADIQRAVTDALGALVERHATLRTLFTFPPASDPPYVTLHETAAQRVVKPDIPHQVRVVDEVASTREFVASQYEAYEGAGGRSIDPTSEPPMWLVYERPDGRWDCVLVASHLVTDGAGLRTLAAEYRALLAGTPVSALPPAAHPLDVHAFERSEEGRRLSDRNVAAMRARLLAVPPEHLALRAPGRAVSSYVSASSPSLHGSLEELSRRWRIPGGGLVAALTALVVWDRYEWPNVAMCSLVRMPNLVRGANYAGANAITSLVVASPLPALTVRRYLHDVWVATVDAYRACAHDPAAFHVMATEVGARHGLEAPDGLIYVNYHSIPSVYESVLSEDDEDSSSALDGRPVRYRISVDVAKTSAVTRLSLTAVDTGHVAPALAARLVELAELLVACDDTTTLSAIRKRLHR